MTIQTHSLVHQIRRPGIDSSCPPPLLLLLHSFGRNEEELMGLVSRLDKRFFIVSPRAPITLRSGSYVWFNINFTSTGAEYNLQEVESTQFTLLNLIDELVEVYGLDAKQVYLMGFSQGAIMNFVLALTQPNKFAGVVAVSGDIPSVILPQMDPKALTDLPIFMAHGTADSVISIEKGRANCDLLLSLPVTLTYREYLMGHQIDADSFTDINLWLTEHLDQSTTDALSGKR